MRWIILLILLMPIVSASEMYIDVSLTKNDMVNEDIYLSLDGNYSFVEFGTMYKPLHINSEQEYEIIKKDQGYSIVFPFNNEIKFSLLYNNLIDKVRNKRIFRTSYAPEQVDVIYVNVTLPPYFILSEKQPNIIPKPNQILTNGQQIRMNWKFEKETELSIFYEKEHSINWLIIPAVFICLFIISMYFINKKYHRKINEMLSPEETKVLEQIKKGENKQNKIANTLDFSKSKMSKIVRKLEEKKIIKKEPYFKTNILKKI